ncbi:SAM-dependent methyltransferase [Nocardioides iriomotensis]|uniref:Class I SAM-dependent methyltransferase n=1 Tax=Nocardioides iriomotensis TaxID=715784 RepID=A0A4Q5JAA0_9ACTN|nr:class I SAM-dependent methyltransferase [Nocardioides iriomotensis]RYU15692.1 class I SAM-dependent methyltransferase [Nocardioides iriomotensis]
MDVRAMAKVVRAGDIRTRVRALRDGQAAIRLAMTAAAVDLGVLDTLETPRTVEELGERHGFVDVDLARAFVATLEAGGLVTRSGDRLRLTRRGTVVRSDPVVRATYSAFSDFHTGLYRDLGGQLGGGSARDDVTRRAPAIADLSRFMQPLVESLLRGVVESRPTRSVLDVGCGAGMLLSTMLHAAPDATGTGLELDPAAAALAERNLTDQGLAQRSEVLVGEARERLAGRSGFDVALLANVVYYLPVDERPALLRLVHDVLAPGGTVVVVTTVLEDNAFSRHFDLLLRAQEGAMQLPVAEELAGQLREAGFADPQVRRVSPGESMTAFVASVPGVV